MISVTSGLPKFVGVSSKHLRVFLKSLRQSSDIFGNFRKFSENVLERSLGLRDNFGKSSESGRESSENHQKRRNQYDYIIKKNITRYLEVMTFMLLLARAISILLLPLEHLLSTE